MKIECFYYIARISIHKDANGVLIKTDHASRSLQRKKHMKKQSPDKIQQESMIHTGRFKRAIAIQVITCITGNAGKSKNSRRAKRWT
jgi:hypothetical protein